MKGAVRRARRTASRTLRVPCALMAKSVCGSSTEVVTATCAAKCSTSVASSCNAKARATSLVSRISTAKNSSFPGCCCNQTPPLRRKRGIIKDCFSSEQGTATCSPPGCKSAAIAGKNASIAREAAVADARRNWPSACSSQEIGRGSSLQILRNLWSGESDHSTRILKTLLPIQPVFCRQSG